MSPTPKNKKSRRKAVFCCSFFVRALDGAGGQKKKGRLAAVSLLMKQKMFQSTSVLRQMTHGASVCLLRGAPMEAACPDGCIIARACGGVKGCIFARGTLRHLADRAPQRTPNNTITRRHTSATRPAPGLRCQCDVLRPWVCGISLGRSLSVAGRCAPLPWPL